MTPTPLECLRLRELLMQTGVDVRGFTRHRVPCVEPCVRERTCSTKGAARCLGSSSAVIDDARVPTTPHTAWGGQSEEVSSRPYES